jgi:hypothetical protein
VFLGRRLRTPHVRRVVPSSKTKLAHFIRVTHRDEVEPPLTDWLREAYALQEAAPLPRGRGTSTGSRARARRTARRRAR